MNWPYVLRRELSGCTLVDRRTGRRVGAIWESRQLARMVRDLLNAEFLEAK